jgi:transcription elongation factor S-II
VLNNIDRESYINNAKLLERLKEKEFCPHDIAFMRPENVCPEKWTASVNALMKKYESAYENKATAMTNMFKCGKCKKRECTFYELQSRSGDEGTTIFIRCVNCGNSWRQ